MSEESIFTTASKLIHQTRQKEKHKVPEGHLDPQMRGPCPNGFKTPEDIQYWINHNPGKHVLCDDCMEGHNRCPILKACEDYLRRQTKEARTR